MAYDARAASIALIDHGVQADPHRHGRFVLVWSGRRPRPAVARGTGGEPLCPAHLVV
jgi:hypothetical protein